MANQTQNKADKKFTNILTIDTIQSDGVLLSLLRNIRKHISDADNLSNEYNSQLKTNIVVPEVKVTEEPKEEVKLVIQKEIKVQTEEEKQAERKLFEEQVGKIGRKKPFQSDQNRQKPFQKDRNAFQQKPNFQPRTGHFDQKRTFNNDNRKPTFNRFGNNRPNDHQSQPNNKFSGKSQFVTSKENAFKKFAPAPTEKIIVQQERNYGNKNKAPYNKTNEERSRFGNRKVQARRGFIDLDVDNEERVTFRKLAKAKKKAEVFVAPSITSATITGESVTVKTLSEKIGKPAGEIIKKLMLLGVMATINSSIDFATAELVASDLGVTLNQKIEKTFEDELNAVSKQEEDADAIKRPPVVTVMGHVDHGKTSLLDAIRKTNIASGEAGGITQKIGAYSISVNGEKITFIDTPGHAAFTAMRARGAKVTDIAILIVAADDGIMPQTVEAINHIKAANVPMIVAINKMDKPEANPERIKAQLAENGVLPEEWGGDTMLVPISAKSGVGIDKLIESILLLAEILELKANPNKKATGTIIEAELDKNRGPIATVLVQSGTLKVGDSIMSGITFGKVKAMFDENGKNVKEVLPSTPVSILGFSDVPNSGDLVYAVDEKLSKNVISERKDKLKKEQALQTSGVSLDDFMDRVNEGKLKTLNIIIKADVQGSVEALKQTLTAIKNEEVRVVCIHSGVGNVTESDLILAQASGAVIINFNLKVLPKLQTMADNMKVQVKDYKVIYECVDDITESITGMMAVKYEQVVAGHADVRVVFKLSTYGLIAGSYVTDGKIIRGAMGRLIRDGEIVADTEISALKIVKDDKAEVNTGFECGIKLKDITELKEGDIIECYQNIPIKR